MQLYKYASTKSAKTNVWIKLEVGIIPELSKAVSNFFICFTECGIAPNLIAASHTLKNVASKKSKYVLIFYWSKTVWDRVHTKIKNFQSSRVIWIMT